MDGNTQISLINIAERHKLSEDLAILGEEGKLEEILRLTKNFSLGQPLGMATESKTVPLFAGSIAEKAIEYVSLLINKYEDTTELFNTTLEMISMAPQDKKYECMSNVIEMVKIDVNSNGREYVMPSVIEDVFFHLTMRYKPMNGSKNVSQEFVNDLNKAMKYAETKIQQNEKYDGRANYVDFHECFPDNNGKSIDLTPEIVLSAINKRMSPSQLIGQHGKPIGMSVKGNRGLNSATVVLYFGTAHQQEMVRVPHPEGLSPHAKRFYIGLGEYITPISALKPLTDKCMHHMSY